MGAGDWKAARELAAWKERVVRSWRQVRVAAVSVHNGVDRLRVDQPFDVAATVHLGELTPQDVAVELYLGRVDPAGDIQEGQALVMQHESQDGGEHVFAAHGVSYRASGTRGLTVRLRPSHPDLVPQLVPELITWA